MQRNERRKRSCNFFSFAVPFLFQGRGFWKLHQGAESIEEAQAWYRRRTVQRRTVQRCRRGLGRCYPTELTVTVVLAFPLGSVQQLPSNSLHLCQSSASQPGVQQQHCSQGVPLKNPHHATGLVQRNFIEGREGGLENELSSILALSYTRPPALCLLHFSSCSLSFSPLPPLLLFSLCLYSFSRPPSLPSIKFLSTTPVAWWGFFRGTPWLGH